MRKEDINLMKVFRIIGRSIRDSFKSIGRNFSLSFASIMCTTITLILVSVAIICAANIENATKLIEDELSIVIYLDSGLSEEKINNIKMDINSQSNVSECIFKSKDEWKLEMKDFSTTYGTILDYLDNNPLLDSFQVKVYDIEDIHKTAEYIKSIEGVKEVKYGEGMVETVVSTFDVVEKIVIVVVVALILVTAFLISNTIKLTIINRRNEIEIMRLVGASNTFIKLPFVIEGFIIGIIGSIIPICITIYGYVILFTKMGGELFTNLIILIKPYNFVFYVSLILVIIGALVGMFGSLKAVRKHLKI